MIKCRTNLIYATTYSILFDAIKARHTNNNIQRYKYNALAQLCLSIIYYTDISIDIPDSKIIVTVYVFQINI